jgi:serine protease Do
MNTKQILTGMGECALAIGLVALPGASARKADVSTARQEKSCTQLEQSEGPSGQLQQLHDALDNLQLARVFTSEGDDDVQVFVDSKSGWLGVGISEVTPDKAKQFKLPAERGVVLGKVVPDSPAAKAGLKEGDVVTEINGERVEGTEQFRRMIREIPSGRAAQFTVWRDGRSQTLSVTMGKHEMRHGDTFVAPAMPGNFAFQMPELPDMSDVFEGGPWLSSRTRLGIDAENVDGEFGNYFGAPEGEGILVRGVFPDSPAAKAGLKVGDVITSINGQRIRSVGELRSKLAENHEDKTVKLGVIRNKAAITLPVELPPPAEKREFHSGVRTSI